MKNLESLKNEVFNLEESQSNITGGSWWEYILNKYTYEEKSPGTEGHKHIVDDNGDIVFCPNPPKNTGY